MTTYAIIGASGKVGFATSSTLRESGASVRAIVREESKVTPLASLGCETAVVDLHDVHSLTRAIENIDVVQIIIPPAPGAEDPVQDMKDVMKNLVNALERTRPRRVLMISDYGAHICYEDIGMPSLFHTFEERLRRLESSHKIFLRSAEHMENWGRSLPNVIASGTLATFFDPVDRKLPTISAPDVGVIAAQLLLLPLKEGGGTTVVHAEGPRQYSASDVAAAFGEVLDRTINVEGVPRSQWDGIFRQVMKPSLADLLIKTNDAQNKGGLIEAQPGSTEVRYGTTELVEALRALVER